METPKRPLQTGDCVFFKSIRIGTKREAPTVNFKGHGFGILLGMVQPFAKEPDSLHLIRQLGTIGYIAFDDVGDMLGAELASELLAKFEAKYYAPKKADDDAGDDLKTEVSTGDPAIQPEPSKLIGMDGKPIQ